MAKTSTNYHQIEAGLIYGWVGGVAMVSIEIIAIAKSFFRSGKPCNPPCPPLKKGGNCKELLSKSPFEKGGFRGI